MFWWIETRMFWRVEPKCSGRVEPEGTDVVSAKIRIIVQYHNRKNIDKCSQILSISFYTLGLAKK
jgi:hypothetical protein